MIEFMDISEFFPGLVLSQVAAQSGQNVTLVDLDENILGKAKKSIHVSLQRVAKKQFKVWYMQRFSYAHKLIRYILGLLFVLG